jgi:hypothetical protein
LFRLPGDFAPPETWTAPPGMGGTASVKKT